MAGLNTCFRAALVCGIGLISACQAVGSILAPGRPLGTAGVGEPGKAGAKDFSQTPTGLEARRVTGQLLTPDARLVGNNSAALIDLGGGAFYRILAAAGSLAQKPLSGAKVLLVDQAGTPFGSDSAVTDASGSFSLPAPASGSQVFVRAAFSAAGKEFEFESALVWPATGDATTVLDAASTLVAGKLRNLIAKGSLPLGQLTPDRISALSRAVLGALDAGNLPFMAKGSQDILAAFDQLVLDVPGIREVASSLGEVAVPSGQWQVSTVLSQADLVTRGVIPAEAPPLSAAGSYELDADGRLYLPALGSLEIPIEIHRMAAGGQPERYARLPLGLQNPVLLAFSPDGKLYAAGVDPQAMEIRIFSGAGDMRPLAALPSTLSPADFAAKSRLAIEPDGAIVLARPDLGTISRIPPPAPTTLASLPGAGSLATLPRAGSLATLRRPGGLPTPGLWASYRYVVPTVPPFPSFPPVPTFPPIPSPPPFPGLDEIASYSFPVDFALAGAGQMLLANLEDAVIRQVGKDGAQILAGKPGEKGYRNGRGGQALFGKPRAVVADPDGNVYVIDADARRIRRISPDGSVFLVAGSGADGLTDGPGTVASFRDPRALRIDGQGNLYLVDSEVRPGGPPLERVRKLQRPQE